MSLTVDHHVLRRGLEAALVALDASMEAGSHDHDIEIARAIASAIGASVGGQEYSHLRWCATEVTVHDYLTDTPRIEMTLVGKKE